MAPTQQQHFPRPRTLIHPGISSPVRINSLRSPSARHMRLFIAPGCSLYDGIVRSLAENGIENASLTILGGYFDILSYCVAPPDPSGKAVIAYTKPIDAGAAWLVFGNATLGRSMKGEPIVHCHAAMRTAAGVVKGGHLLTESCIVGEGGISALVTSLDSFVLQQSFDPETNIPLLQPRNRTERADEHA
ncbi:MULTISPECIES: PCC domain-containing protein [Rhizobium/Agrobacterium group]|uniref:PCC domain-containing protein n=1 Tax=Rhizobium/Agrobacterium group TaxID=227290 RepID=UPI000FDCA307|nr:MULTISPECIES: DUF296 domain-containing protein [Rhizobium/Agrobacterium group]MBB4401880.1 hypothetical protein [Agrobacterium radiobacter]MBB5587514.1 hypothetical protein [Agrobacterium radiobacter]RVT80940.1 DUF296 domain-containing protein [Agrobacterium sp. CNPSo 2736]TGE90219.1 DUF296 domain-containing protein [Rhizobium sp. SEMIA 4032]UXT19923.1 DNA-binding protein [Agrobacterium tumefaciens]